MRKVWTLAVSSLLLCSLAAPTSAEFIGGLSAGIVLPGDQDLKFQQHSAGGALLNRIEQRNVDESPGPFGGLSFTAWGDDGLLQYLALQVEGMHWYISADPAPAPPAPDFTVGQYRLAFFFSALGRLPLYPSLGRFSSSAKNVLFGFAGVGGGPIYTSIQHGNSEWGLGFQLLGGFSIPVVSKLRIRLEARYILAPDADNPPREGWRVDTSGSPGEFRWNKHLDTRFIPVLIGFDWIF
ncbi:MAG: hypothetical protein ACE5JS_20875 [Nitrospinota bacterium]